MFNDIFFTEFHSCYWWLLLLIVQTSRFAAPASIPLGSNFGAIVDRFPQPLVHAVVDFTHECHQFSFGWTWKGLQLSLHSQEVGGTQFAGVELSEQDQKGIPLFTQFGGDFVWKAAGHHVQHCPPHPPEFLPRDFVLSLLDEGSCIFVFFFLGDLLPIGQKFLVHDLLAKV